MKNENMKTWKRENVKIGKPGNPETEPGNPKPGNPESKTLMCGVGMWGMFVCWISLKP